MGLEGGEGAENGSPESIQESLMKRGAVTQGKGKRHWEKQK
jgi:hypothetical protein